MAAFNADALNRIRRTVKRSERTPDGRALGDRGEPRPYVRPGALVALTSDITARTGPARAAILGTGTGELLWRDGASTSATGEIVTIYNNLKIVISMSLTDLVQVTWIDGDWFLANGDC